MKITLLVFVFLSVIILSFAGIPLPSVPSWTSSDNDFSTGGALYDITMDGWIDFCTGNGNDMASNTNALYVNQNGILEITASWHSNESGYFSHIYIGDVDNHGYPDMAVSYLGYGNSNQGHMRIYGNLGTGLGSTAWWTSSDEYNSFDCAFGDVDLDGDLDLAIVAGDAYSGLKSPTRVYRNNSGVIETTPYWTSTDSTPGDACRWVDLDNNGYLDLVVGYRHKLSVFNNISGTLEQNASWSTVEPGWILRIAVGDYNNDGYKDIAVACNGQLGGDESRIGVYRNDGGTLQTPPAYTMMTYSTYCSCVEWGDVNNDGWLDLAAGGWWESVVVFENSSGIIDTTPAWSWSGGYGLVCEAVFWGDVRNNALITISDYKSGDGVKKLFYFNHHPIHCFEEVRVNGSPVPLSDFTYDPLTGWISLKNAPPTGSNNIEIQYTYSQYPDLGVTNWDELNGNYLFSNTAGIEETKIATPKLENLKLEVYPNPFSTSTSIQLSDIEHRAEGIELKIYDVSGRAVRNFNLSTAYSILPTNFYWDGTDDFGKKLPVGIYLVVFKNGSESIRGKILMMR